MARRSEEQPDAAHAAVVIPLRSFAAANTRLASALGLEARAALARSMADRVYAAASPLPVVVVSSATDVLAWAAEQHCATIPDPGSLNAAAAAGRRWVHEHGYARAIIVHADLPLAVSLDAVNRGGSQPIAVIVPDHRNDGTPVLSIPAAVDFPFAYGPGSAARHIAAAEACGLEVRVVDDPELAFDVDTPEDLDKLTNRTNRKPVS
jgi:2-phospho-L-lactate guanylyltransferase